MLQNISASMVATFCHDGDVICDGIPITLPSHFTYSEDADDGMYSLHLACPLAVLRVHRLSAKVKNYPPSSLFLLKRPGLISHHYF